MKLGEWAGLCKLDKDGKARKVVKCSSCVVKDWGKESPALDIVKDYIKSHINNQFNFPQRFRFHRSDWIRLYPFAKQVIVLFQSSHIR